MAIYSGKITQKELKTSKTGKEYVCFTIDGKFWNCFDALIHKNYNVGDEVEIETTTQGKFENLKSMNFLAKSKVSPVTQTDPEPSKRVMVGLTDKDRRIVAILKELIKVLEDGNWKNKRAEDWICAE